MIRSSIPLLLVLAGLAAGESKPAPIADTLASMKPPEGIAVQAAVDESKVTQPVSMQIDGRGRLWVAEYRTYAKSYDLTLNDSIAVFTDTDHDGVYDERKVFHEGRIYSGIAVGLGGVFVCAMPNLIFIPDKDGDGVPDGPAEVLLDGWELERGGWTNNTFSNLTWGPDGWIYACSGMSNRSRVGHPGDPPEKRTMIGSGIWRYHPVTREFEVIARGFTNCFGLVFDSDGELLASDVGPRILFHILRGGNYQVEFHPAFVPASAYERLPPIHELKGRNLASGAFLCGESWPADWRNRMLTSRLRTRTIVGNELKPIPGGFGGGPDQVLLPRPADNWWFPVAFCATPSGAALISDWSDANRELHSFPIPDRSGGRIYRVGPTGATEPSFDLPAATDQVLIAGALGSNAWVVEQSRVELQRRSIEKRLGPATTAAVRARLDDPKADVAVRRRALSVLIACTAIDDAALHRLVAEGDERLAITAARALGDQRSFDLAQAKAATGRSPNLRIALAEASFRLPDALRRPLLSALVQAVEPADPDQVALMAWYAVDPVLTTDPAWDRTLPDLARNQKLKGFVQRRLGGPAPAPKVESAPAAKPAAAKPPEPAAKP
ncbi:hypothetical protein LBMAG53_34730 [Planctomycetota bacterium]|nr:hypothetical protein LBMAG53_34730 [Planctomycetota bacterium]